MTPAEIAKDLAHAKSQIAFHYDQQKGWQGIASYLEKKLAEVKPAEAKPAEPPATPPAS